MSHVVRTSSSHASDGISTSPPGPIALHCMSAARVAVVRDRQSTSQRAPGRGGLGESAGRPLSGVRTAAHRWALSHNHQPFFSLALSLAGIRATGGAHAHASAAQSWQLDVVAGWGLVGWGGYRLPPGARRQRHSLVLRWVSFSVLLYFRLGLILKKIKIFYDIKSLHVTRNIKYRSKQKK